jgi:hypothetical protein
VIASARKLNALRAIAALAKVRTDDDVSNAAAARLAREPIDLLLGPGEARAYVAPATSLALVDDWLEAWWSAAHIGPPTPPATAGSPALLTVGGVSGALAVALWIERSQPLRTALCQDCGTTWRPGKNWTEALLIGENRRCPLCWRATYQREHSRGLRRRDGGQS